MGIRDLLDVADTKQALLARNLLMLGEQLLSQGDDSSKVLKDIKDVVTLSNESLEAINHAAILRSLRPVTANKRFDEISDPAADTFRWILEQPQLLLDYHPGISTDLVEWLTSGSGVFHIAGKPGCGKSTLMKCLATHPMTYELLRQWASADEKEVIFSRFFFWKLGSSEQRTMGGLYRGVVYDIAKRSAEVTALLFPQHWLPGRYVSAHAPTPEIDDTQVKLAFDTLLNCDHVFNLYKICIFVDGLDEFDEPPAWSLWKLADQLNKWTTRGNVKLCVSSREEPSILSAFPSCLRLTLHFLTQSDIQALVEDRLGSNPHFSLLTQSDDGARIEGISIKRTIVQHAEGVFLWVVLLLRWMEEELATGATSLGALWNIVETAPRELDQFFTRILESIPKHHQRGAYFAFAMMLRVCGHCISADHRSDELRMSFEMYQVSIFGLSYIFDMFENRTPRKGPGGTTARFWFPVDACTDDAEYRLREAQATTKLQSWCKGLAGASPQTHVYGEAKTAVFTHRSIPEFLFDTFNGAAKKWNFDDDWVTEGILATSLAEAKASHLTVSPGPQVATERLIKVIELVALTTPVPFTPAVFALLDEIDAARQQPRQAGRKSGRLGSVLQVRDLSRLECGGFDPVLAIAAGCRVPLTGYVVSRLKNIQAWHVEDGSEPSYDAKRLLLTLCAVVNRSYDNHAHEEGTAAILEALFATGLTPNIQLPLHDVVEIGIDNWIKYLSSLPSRDHATVEDDQGTIWEISLTAIVRTIVKSDKGTVPLPLWRELEVWLKFGAVVPVRISAGTRRNNLVLWFSFSRRVLAETQKQLAAHSFDGEHYPLPMRQYLQTNRTVTLSSIIRFHAPENAASLLRYTDQVNTTVSKKSKNGNNNETDGDVFPVLPEFELEEWNPPLFGDSEEDSDERV